MTLTSVAIGVVWGLAIANPAEARLDRLLQLHPITADGIGRPSPSIGCCRHPGRLDAVVASLVPGSAVCRSALAPLY